MDSAAEHMHQTDAVGQWLHVIVLDIGRYQIRMDKGRKGVVAQHHQGIGFQGVEDEIGDSLRASLQFWALIK